MKIISKPNILVMLLGEPAESIVLKAFQILFLMVIHLALIMAKMVIIMSIGRMESSLLETQLVSLDTQVLITILEEVPELLLEGILQTA